eukprot:1161073-Pelagomonas_calceolata.AAC.6
MMSSHPLMHTCALTLPSALVHTTVHTHTCTHPCVHELAISLVCACRFPPAMLTSTPACTQQLHCQSRAEPPAVQCQSRAEPPAVQCQSRAEPPAAFVDADLVS